MSFSGDVVGPTYFEEFDFFFTDMADGCPQDTAQGYWFDLSYNFHMIRYFYFFNALDQETKDHILEHLQTSRGLKIM